MKKLLAMALMSSMLFSAVTLFAQDKSTRKSPPAKVSETLKSGATISIDYSQPSLKGRKIGTDVEPKEGAVWRMGANEATVFEADKEVKIEGKELPAGKYSLFGLREGDEFSTIKDLGKVHIFGFTVFIKMCSGYYPPEVFGFQIPIILVFYK